MSDQQSEVPPEKYLALRDRIARDLGIDPTRLPTPRESVPWIGPDDETRDWLARMSREERQMLDSLLRMFGQGKFRALEKFLDLFDAENIDNLKRLLMLGQSTLQVLRFLKAAVIVVASVIGGTVVFGEQIAKIVGWFIMAIRAAAGAKP